MKRDGHIIEEIVAQSNLEESFDTVVRGALRKRLAEGKWLIAHRAEFLESVRQEVLAGHINFRGFHTKIIREGGKERDIQVFNMCDRIKVNAVMSVVDKHLRRRYIRTTGASIKGRGLQDLMSIIQRDLRANPTALRYWYKADIRKCYDTMSQDEVMVALRRAFKDDLLLKILEQFVRFLPGGRGVSKGLRASQGVSNWLLSVAIDHKMKDQYGVKWYYRYCDDILAGASTKEEAWWIRDRCHECVEAIGQKLKPSERIFPVEEGVDFLGYVIWPDHVKLRKRVKQQFARKLARIKSRKRRQALVGSLWGMAKHCQSWHLLETLLYPSEFNKIKKKAIKKRMKDFSQLGVSYTPKDGKKRFANGTTQLRQLVNVRIEVLDFERDVKTKYGERWLVQFRDTRNGTLSKFFTDCDEMKNILDQLDNMNEIPFATTIAAEYFGDNKVKYKFT